MSAQKYRSQICGYPKNLPKTGTTRLPRSATLATATAKIPQHWLDYTTEVIGQAETVAACRKLAYEIMGDVATKYEQIRGLVAPRWRAKMHPEAPLITQQSTTVFPVNVGQDWTREELEAAVEQGTHKSA